MSEELDLVGGPFAVIESDPGTPMPTLNSQCNSCGIDRSLHHTLAQAWGARPRGCGDLRHRAVGC